MLVENIENHISNKGLLSTIHKEFSNSYGKKTNSLRLKWAKYINQTLHQTTYTKATKQMKRCQTSLVMMKIQSKFTMKSHLSPPRVTILKGLPI